MGEKEIVLVIPDTQYPYHHRDHLKFLCAVRDKYQPTRIVHIGDLMDFHAMSDYTPSPSGHSPGEEFKIAKRCVKKLYAEFPEAQLVFSNHDSRPYRRAAKSGIPESFMKEYAEWMEFPEGWSISQKVEIDGVIYEHGMGCGGELAHKKAALANMQSTVMGHLHTNFGVEYAANPKALLFGLAVGCLIDCDSYAFAYGKDTKKKPILGCGIVNKGIPIPVPMSLRKGGRWVGEL